MEDAAPSQISRSQRRFRLQVVGGDDSGCCEMTSFFPHRRQSIVDASEFLSATRFQRGHDLELIPTHAVGRLLAVGGTKASKDLPDRGLLPDTRRWIETDCAKIRFVGTFLEPCQLQIVKHLLGQGSKRDPLAWRWRGSGSNGARGIP